MTRRYIYGLLTLGATIFVAVQVMALETLSGEPGVEDKVEIVHGQAMSSDDRVVRGRVVAVDPASARVTLEYRPIPQLLLEGGTRIFRVQDPTELEGLGPGDKVRFEVEREGRSFIVKRIENSN